MSVDAAVAAAETVLQSAKRPASDDEIDPRWQAIIEVSEFIETEPGAVWEFAARWGSSPDADIRMAIAACVLEHLFEHHFDLIISRVETFARSNDLFADTVRSCWKFGLAVEEGRAARLDRLLASLRGGNL